MAGELERQIQIIYETHGAEAVKRAAAAIEERLGGVEKATDGVTDAQGRLRDAAGKFLPMFKDGVADAAVIQAKLNAKIDEMKGDAAFDRAALKSRAFVKALKESEAAARRLEYAGMSAFEKFESAIEKTEVLTGALDVAVMAGEAFWATWTAGAQAADLKATVAQFQGIANASQGAASVLGKSAASRNALRGREMGLTDATLAKVTQLAEAAAARTVATEGGNFKELVQQFTTQFQDELQTGQLGSAFQALGADAGVVEAEIRRQARAMGVLPEALSATHREAIILESGMYSAARGMAAFRVDAQKTQSSVEAFLKSTAEDFATLFVRADTLDTVDTKKRRLSSAERELEAQKILANSGGGGREGVAAAAATKAFELTKEVAQLKEDIKASKAARSAALAAPLTEQLKRRAEGVEQRLTKEERAQFGDTAGADSLRDLAHIYRQIAETREKGGVYEKQHLKVLREQLVSVGKMDDTQAESIIKLMTAAHLKGEAQKLEVHSLKVAQESLQNRAAFERRQLAINKGLTRAKRIEIARSAAAKEYRANIAAQSDSMDAFRAALEGEGVQRRMNVATQKAQVEIELEFASALTDSQKEALELRKKILTVQDEVARSTDNAADFNRQMGRVVLARTFGDGVDAIERLNQRLGGTKAQIQGVLGLAARMAGTFDKVSGGGLLGIGLSKGGKADPARRGGRGGRDGAAELLRRAETAGVDELVKMDIEIQRQLAKDLKTARGRDTLIEAAMGVHAEGMRELNKKIEQRMKEAAEKARAEAEKLGGAFAGVGSRMIAKLNAREDLSFRAGLRGQSGEERGFAQRRKAIEDQLASDLATHRDNDHAKLEALLVYWDARDQITRERQEAEAQREAQRLEQINADIQRTIDATRAMHDQFELSASGEGVFKMTSGLMAMGDALTAVQAAQEKNGDVVGPALAAGDKLVSGMIENQKAMAVWKAAMSFANAGFAFASMDWIRGAMFSAAGIQYTAIAAGNPKSKGGGGSSGGSRQRARTSQDRGSQLPVRRQQGPQTILNVFVDPLSGQAVVRAANGAVARGSRVKFDGRLNSNAVMRTEL